MRLGLFGGTFDPIHVGHLKLATGLVEQLQLDEVWFIPAAIPWMKEGMVIASSDDRIEMVRLGIEHEPRFQVCDWEVRSGGYSYTIDTLKRARREMDNSDEAFVIIGSDVIHRFLEWKQYDEILSLSTLVVVMRPGFEYDAEDEAINKLARMGRVVPVKTPVLDIQSSDIRDRISNQEFVSAMVPAKVEEHIRMRGLYHLDTRINNKARREHRKGTDK